MGKDELLSKLLPGGRGVWIPIDHGVSDYPVEGLTDTEATIKSLISAGVDAIIAHKLSLIHISEPTRLRRI